MENEHEKERYTRLWYEKFQQEQLITENHLPITVIPKQNVTINIPSPIGKGSKKKKTMDFAKVRIKAKWDNLEEPVEIAAFPNVDNGELNALNLAPLEPKFLRVKAIEGTTVEIFVQAEFEKTIRLPFSVKLMGQIFFGEESKGCSSVTVTQMFNTNTFTLMEIFLANLVIIVPLIADIGGTGLENGRLGKVKTDGIVAEKIAKVLLPVKCVREGKSYSLRVGIEGQDAQAFENAKFQKLWYGFTTLNYKQFANDREGSPWQNKEEEFLHEEEKLAQYDENGNSTDIEIEVPPGKNVVFRVEFEFNTEIRSTSVFYVNTTL